MTILDLLAAVVGTIVVALAVRPAPPRPAQLTIFDALAHTGD